MNLKKAFNPLILFFFVDYLLFSLVALFAWSLPACNHFDPDTVVISTVIVVIVAYLIAWGEANEIKKAILELKKRGERQ